MLAGIQKGTGLLTTSLPAPRTVWTHRDAFWHCGMMASTYVIFIAVLGHVQSEGCRLAMFNRDWESLSIGGWSVDSYM